MNDTVRGIVMLVLVVAGLLLVFNHKGGPSIHEDRYAQCIQVMEREEAVIDDMYNAQYCRQVSTY